MNVIVLFGKPGAGKGTRLSEFLEGKEDQYMVLSVGNLLRKARKDKTELGQKASYYMDAGLLVPDEIINAIAIEAMKNAEKPIFTDGFPRTVSQAKAMLEAGVRPATVVHFDIDDEEVIDRAKNRIVCESCSESYTISGFKPPLEEGICDKCGSKLVKRKDDNEDTVRNRLKVYQKETYPVLEVMKKAGITIHTIENTDTVMAKVQFAELMYSL